MKMPTLIPGREHEEDPLNPGDKNYRQSINDRYSQPGSVSQNDVERGLKAAEEYANDKNNHTQNSDIKEKEAQGSYRSTYGQNAKPTKVKSKKGRVKKLLPLFGISGLVGVVGLAFFALLPLKLNMFVDNITSIASSVPGYAIERRTEYIFTQLFATHLIKKANGIDDVTASDAASKAVFCKTASVSCSLALTYGANYFDNLIKVERGEQLGNNTKLTITPIGVTQLGGNARSWTVEVAGDLGDGKSLETKIQNFESNREMKLFLKDMVSKDLKTKTVATRYLARAILMKQYGVTHWRAFEKTSNKVAETKTNIKTSVMQNTVGKVSKKMSIYMGCFSDPTLCANIKKGISNSALKLKDEIDALNKEEPKTEAERIARDEKVKRLEARKDSYDSMTGEGITEEDMKSGGTMKEIILKRVMMVAGAMSLVGVIDMIFGAVGAVDKGALEQVSADMAKMAYVGMAYGEGTGFVPNADKLKAGDIDLESYGEIISMLDGAEQSPLMQFENGLVSADQVASGSVTRICNVEDAEKKVTLAKGELVCTERKIVRDYTSLVRENPVWIPIAAAADVWNSTVGAVIDWIGGLISQIPGIKEIAEYIGQITAPLIEWIISLFFVPPVVGPETDGMNNYDALSGGIRVSQNDMMENGTLDNKAYGGGGTVLTDQQVAAITNEVQQDEQEYYNQQSMVAKAFNVNLKGSFAQQLVAQTPTTLGSLLKTPATAFSTLASSLSSKTSAASTASVNPFSMPIYGYAPNDPAFTANLDAYTEASCTESAAAREASYGDDINISTVPVYTKTDPCALEKMVVGSMLQAQGVTDDPYSLEEPGAAPQDTNTTTRGNYPRPENVIDRNDGWTTTAGVDYSAIPCDPRTQDVGIATSASNGSKIRLCRINTPAWPSLGANENEVASIVSRNVFDMFEDAEKAGVPIALSSAFRSDSTTEHGKGLAMDIRSVKTGFSLCYYAGGSKMVWDACDQGMPSQNPNESAAFRWLRQNAAKYGFHNLKGTPLWEPWHWSTSGY